MGKKIIVFFLLIVISGCNSESMIGAHRSIDFFAWSSNNSKVIAIVDDFDKNPYSNEIITYDITGRELSNVPLIGKIDDREFPRSARLFLLSDDQTIIAQKGSDIAAVNVLTGASTTVASGRILIDLSPSKKLFFTKRDTMIFLSQIEGTQLKDLHQFDFALTYKNYPYFISDSLWYVLTTPNVIPGDTSCSLLVFDTSINQIKVFQDCLTPYSYASESKELATLNDNHLIILNIQNSSKKEFAIASNPSFSKITSDGKTVYYLSGNTQPYQLHSISVVDGSDSILASDVETDIQLSPDNKLLAYFATVNKDITIKVVLVK